MFEMISNREIVKTVLNLAVYANKKWQMESHILIKYIRHLHSS